jgi:HSP20 family protein
MAITDMIPWRKNETSVPVHRKQEEEKFLDFRSQMNRLFDDFFEQPLAFSPFFGEPTLMGDITPRLDVSETENEITISAELPGMEPEDIHITVDRNALTISGEKRAEKEEKGKRYYRVERSYGSFRRSVALPKEVEESKIDATFKRGVLKITLPKTKSAQEESKQITINTD